MHTSSRSRLVASAMMLVASCALFVGLTFAWFTDSVANKGNAINTGAFEVKLHKMNKGTWQLVESEKPVIDETAFEPGSSSSVLLQVGNTGTLSAKYELRFANVAATQGIDEALEVYLVPSSVGNPGESLTVKYKLGTLAEMVGGNRPIASGDVLAGASKEIGFLVIKLPETAANSYEGANVTFDLELVATQAASELDGFGNGSYDDRATVPVVTERGLRDGIATGGIVTLGSDFTLRAANGVDHVEPFAVENTDVTVDFAGKTVSNADDIWTDGANWSIFSARAGSNLTLRGKGTVRAKADDCFAVDVCDGGKLTIKDGTYVGNLSAVYVEEGELVIEGGTFSIQQLKSGTGEERYRETLNCLDKNYLDGTARITVKGGTFMNFNPAASTAEPGGANLVAEGYKVVSEVRDGATWYTVVPA